MKPLSSEKQIKNYLQTANDMQTKKGHIHSDEYIPIIGSSKPNDCGLVKGRGPGINSSQSKNVGKIQLSMQLSHLSIIFENIWF